MDVYIKLASGLLATVYGFGEPNCGDVGAPRPCELGAITASGEVFDPLRPMAATAAPLSSRVHSRYVGMRVADGLCHPIRIADKSNPRFIGVRGFDLSPKAVELLTGKPATPWWSGRVYLCKLPGELEWTSSLNVSRMPQPLALRSSQWHRASPRRPHNRPPLRPIAPTSSSKT